MKVTSVNGVVPLADVEDSHEQSAIAMVRSKSRPLTIGFDEGDVQSTPHSMLAMEEELLSPGMRRS